MSRCERTARASVTSVGCLTVRGRAKSRTSAVQPPDIDTGRDPPRRRRSRSCGPWSSLCNSVRPEHRKRPRRGNQMSQKTSHIRGFRAALAAAGSNIHPALVPGSALWFWALAAAMLFGVVGCPSWVRRRRRACAVVSGAMRCRRDRRSTCDEVRRSPIALDVAARLATTSRQAAIAEWTGRMVDEHVSSRLFAGLLPQMMRAGVDAGFQARRRRGGRRRASARAAVRGRRRGAGRRGARPAARARATFRATTTSTSLEALLRNVLSIICLERDGRRSRCSRTTIAWRANRRCGA